MATRGGLHLRDPVNSLLFTAMSRQHRYKRLPDEDLTPSRPISDVPIDVQKDHMLELRRAQNQIADGHAVRDGLMHAWALSNTLSRHDMAIATGLVKSRVDQLIREAYERDVWRRNREARERVERHLRPS